MNHKVAFSFADGKTLFFPVGANEILLDAALRNGIKIPLDCREGVCGTCQGRCESGDYTQDYVDDEALSSLDLQQRKMLSCQTRVKSDATFYFDFDSSLCNAPNPVQVRGTVSEVQQVSASTAILHVQLDAPLDFLPGQYARLSVPGTDSWRSYSFANLAGNQLQFLIRLLPDGVMSNYLRERCQVGDELLMEAPLGAFYLRHVTQPLVLVAGGTGLSALLGMLDQLAATAATSRCISYYGVRGAEDLCEATRIAAYAATTAGFSLHRSPQRRRSSNGRASAATSPNISTWPNCGTDRRICMCAAPLQWSNPSNNGWRIRHLMAFSCITKSLRRVISDSSALLRGWCGVQSTPRKTSRRER